MGGTGWSSVDPCGLASTNSDRRCKEGKPVRGRQEGSQSALVSYILQLRGGDRINEATALQCKITTVITAAEQCSTPIRGHVAAGA